MIDYPSNALFFAKILCNIINFDALEIDFFTVMLFNFSFEDEVFESKKYGNINGSNKILTE